MHEMALCESILHVLEAQAEAQQYRRVNRVRLEIGALASVEVEALRFNFDVVTRDSLADGAGLEIVERPGQARCMQCMKPVQVQRRSDGCPECGSYQLLVTGGEEMKILELEVE
jgi:hydrogenase nickel incorporation protein HypA/HybF